MPTFAYKARSLTGQLESGTLVADSSAAVARMLSERALMPVQVDEVAAQQTSFLTGGMRRVPISKIGVIYEQLSDLLKAGVPVLRAIDVLSKQAGHAGLTRVLREIHKDVAGGDTLADALGKHPQAFPELHVSMIRAGEKGGFIEDVLSRLSQFVTRQDELRNKFMGAMIYPSVLLFGLIGAFTFLMAFVVPKIRYLIEDQPNLPTPTIIVFAVNDMFSKHFVVMGGVLLVIGIVIYAALQSEGGKRFMAVAQLRAIGIGRIYTMVALCRFCRIFGTLLASGIPILQALRIAKDSTGNIILAESIDKATENVRSGESLAGPLGACGLFPPAVINMIAVAEESNTLEKVLIEIAESNEARTARQIDLAVRMLEPLMLLMMAALVGFIAVALLVPILQMATSGLK
ncbi:MAG: type II secretion system F family protein [Phycisphaerales bacterium]|nr:type II secretion system F family protein [Phycisphaerales bacterium]